MNKQTYKQQWIGKCANKPLRAGLHTLNIGQKKHSITKTGSKHSIYVPKFHKSAKFQYIIYHNKKQVMESKNVMLVSSMGITACLEESIQWDF